MALGPPFWGFCFLVGGGDGETGSMHDDGGPFEAAGANVQRKAYRHLFGGRGFCDVSFDVISTSRV